MEYSLFMIKPCAYKEKKDILNILNQRLNIIFIKDIILNEQFLDKLYGNEQNEIYKKINTEYLKGKPACIGIVSGKNAINDLIEVCGSKPLGSMCDKDSIRYRYAPKEEIIHLKKDQVFFVNAIHKASPEEALEQVCLFITEFFKDELGKCNIINENSNDKEIYER